MVSFPYLDGAVSSQARASKDAQHGAGGKHELFPQRSQLAQLAPSAQLPKHKDQQHKSNTTNKQTNRRTCPAMPLLPTLLITLTLDFFCSSRLCEWRSSSGRLSTGASTWTAMVAAPSRATTAKGTARVSGSPTSSLLLCQTT